MKLRITIAGKTYEADVEVLEEDEAEPHAPEAAYALPANDVEDPAVEIGAGFADKTCRSPVAGMVIRVFAEAGQAVKAGQVLVVLEAMKMETQVTAPCAGTVETVHVAPGNSVKPEQVLVQLA